MTPLVTIGIPTYNVGRFIALSIKSVLAQTYANFELIITDDGSIDNTVEEIRKFSDPRIKLIVDGENHGISFRLNQQIDMATGEIFVRMDGDDLMFPTRVEEQVKFLLDHPEVEVVGSEAVIIDDDNNVIGCRRIENNTKQLRELYAASFFMHPTVSGRTGFFRKNPYLSDYDGCEDHNLWIRGFSGNNYYILQQPLMFYRDPCVFKLKTYLFRMKTLRIMYSNYIDSDKENATYLRKLIYKIYIKTVFSYVLSKLGLDSVMISRRNQSCEITQYQSILNNVLSYVQ